MKHPDYSENTRSV